MTYDLTSSQTPPAAASKPKARRRRSDKATIPFATATAGNRAREEIKRILRHFGAEEIGFSDNFQEHEVLLYFRHPAGKYATSPPTLAGLLSCLR